MPWLACRRREVYRFVAFAVPLLVDGYLRLLAYRPQTVHLGDAQTSTVTRQVLCDDATDRVCVMKSNAASCCDQSGRGMISLPLFGLFGFNGLALVAGSPSSDPSYWRSARTARRLRVDGSSGSHILVKCAPRQHSNHVERPSWPNLTRL